MYPRLTKKTKETILGSAGIMGKIADIIGGSQKDKKPLSQVTVERMVERNDLILTHPVVLAVLENEIKVSDNETLTTIEQTA